MGVSTSYQTQSILEDLKNILDCSTIFIDLSEMGKYRVLRFEFPASSFPIFGFPDAENSVTRAENSELSVHSSSPLAENSAMLLENSDVQTKPSCPLAENRGIQT